jgi:hypothetical protein
MKIGQHLILVLLALSVIHIDAMAHATYVGYSGAPGSGGSCAASCHGSSGGTIVVSGFPTEYVAGQSYTVSVTHSGGSMIKQFNGSCRVGSGSTNAGVISSGSSTATYSTSGETNGVHLTSTDIMGGSFTWVAPEAGTGEVRLYIAGHQGASGGANTNLVLTATAETSDVPTGDAALSSYYLAGNYPNPFVSETAIGFALPQAGFVRFEIFDMSGRLLESWGSDEPAGPGQFTWSAADRPSGVYFCRMRADGFAATQKMLISR